MTGRTYLITGGGGFVGRGIARALLERGDRVRSLARGSYPELAALGVEAIKADISDDLERFHSAFEGVTGVFHTAAKVEMWGARDGFFRTNVIGTRNIMAGCERHGVSHMVFTSSPSVIHDGSNLNGVDESYPYPDHYDAHYPETKAIAEREVLARDASGALRTVALRPHLIWGPGDTNLIPTIVARARAGKLKRIGNGKNLVDLTYIDDCVRAHMLAMDLLESDPNSIGGKVYFISQGDPVELWPWIDNVLRASGLPPVTTSIPTSIAMRVARVFELMSSLLLKFGVEYKPLLTRFLVSEMASNHYFDISRARRELGFQPSCTIAEALAKTFPGKF